jgi:hypothetical protein
MRPPASIILVAIMFDKRIEETNKYFIKERFDENILKFLEILI